jgi:hypothetical protein
VPKIKNQWIWNIVLAWTPVDPQDRKTEALLARHVPAAWDVDVSPASIL